MKVLIIEDEPRSARELSQLITTVDPGISVIATLESVEQAIAWFGANPQPDLVFSDIQLTDGLSFEIYEKVPIICPIIFCTAFDDYLMDAFDTNAISYLLKPVTRDKVETALKKFNTLKAAFGNNQGNPSLRDLIHQLRRSYKNTILVHVREKIIPLQTRDIAYFYMEHTVVEVCTLEKQKYFMTGSMDEMENMLDPDLFYRANRQFLINRGAIMNAERSFSRKLVVELSVPTSEPIIVSKAKASEFLHWLAQGQ